MLQPGIDYDPDPINSDAFGLEDSDRAKLSDLIVSKGPQAAKEFLEAKFGITWEQLAREIEQEKVSTERSKKAEHAMAASYARFLLHFPLFLNTERNQQSFLKYLREERHLKDFDYQTVCDFYHTYAHIDGALDLDEGNSGTSNPYYVGQITPGSELDADYAPKKSIRDMSATEFDRALARSPKFKARIDGPKE